MKSPKQDIQLIACQWAREWAEKSLQFAGEKPFSGMSIEQATAIKKSLIFYCEAGATEAVQGLNRHGNKLVI